MPHAMPAFDVVTGVSTGALIAPFAFLGDARSIDTIVELYRNPGRDLVKRRWPLYFLLVNTTDVDDGGNRVWDVGSEAQRAVDSGDVDRVHRILLASSGIPGAFPFREDGSLDIP